VQAVWPGGPDVHGGASADTLQPLENLDMLHIVGGSLSHGGRSPRFVVLERH